MTFKKVLVLTLFIFGVTYAGTGCTCSDGTPAPDGDDCTVSDSEICISCDDGFGLGGGSCNACAPGEHTDGDSLCQVNVCTCTDGTGSTGPACPTHDSEHCSDCDAGFHDAGDDLCTANVCTCDDGTVATGVDCVNNGDHTCTACNTGFHEEGDGTCDQNICFCDNGSEMTGVDCTMDGMHMCASCDAGFHDEGDNTCDANVCTCDDGTVAVSGTADCANDGDHTCTACNTGFHEEGDGTCDQNICTCSGGTEMTGTDCTMDGMEMCASCGTGFHMEDDMTCDQNVCTCSGGTAMTLTACTMDDMEMCASCDTGFHMEDDNTCDQNICFCDDGTEMTGVDCTMDGMHMCASCDTGFHDEGDNTCDQNICTCLNGEPMTGAMCTMDNMEMCASCDLSFHIEGMTCEQNICVCDSGTEFTGIDCTMHNMNMCESCDDGHHINGNDCEDNVCVCDEGTPAMTGMAACHTHNENICSACDFGFTLADESCTITITGELEDMFKHVKGYSFMGEDCVRVQRFPRFRDIDENTVVGLLFRTKGFCHRNDPKSKWEITDEGRICSADSQYAGVLCWEVDDASGMVVAKQSSDAESQFWAWDSDSGTLQDFNGNIVMFSEGRRGIFVMDPADIKVEAEIWQDDNKRMWGMNFLHDFCIAKGGHHNHFRKREGIVLRDLDSAACGDERSQWWYDPLTHQFKNVDDNNPNNHHAWCWFESFRSIQISRCAAEDDAHFGTQQFKWEDSGVISKWWDWNMVLLMNSNEGRITVVPRHKIYQTPLIGSL